MFDLNRRGVKIILSSASLLVLSFLLCMAMVCEVLEPDYILVFTAFTLSLVGLIAGFVLFWLGPTSPAMESA